MTLDFLYVISLKCLDFDAGVLEFNVKLKAFAAQIKDYLKTAAQEGFGSKLG